MNGKQTFTPTIKVSAPETLISDRHVRYCSKASLVLLGYVGLVGFLDTIGWALGLDWIKRPIPNESATPSGAAILFFLSAINMFLLSARRAKTWQKWAAVTLSVIIGISSGATWLEHVFEQDWGLIHPLYTTEGCTPLTFPGPMMPDVSAYFFLIALALTLYALRDKVGIKAMQIVAGLVGLPNLLIFLCYFCGMKHLCAYFGCIKFSPVTSFTFVLLCAGMIIAEPEQGFTNIFVRSTSAGKIARRLFLMASMLFLLIPLRLLLLAYCLSAKLADEPIINIGTGIVGLLATGAFIAWSLRKFDTVEAQKQQAEAEKSEAISQLDSIISKAPARRFKTVCLECGEEYDEEKLVCSKDGSKLSKVLDKLKAGDMFAERYEIKKTLGAGGMSTVYLANHVLMNKLMAVKLLHDHLSTDVSAVQRFQREAQTVTLLSHPNILAVHDFGLSPDGVAYLVMDYIDGASLQEYIALKKTIHWQKACQFFLQICSGLQHAHVKGVVHRDLKPGNIMMTRGEDHSYMLKIVDFGLAKICGDDSAQRLTQTGEIFGSPLYMSPEQCQGGMLDHRSDIYAMGIIMYETITGQPPFRGKSIVETFQKQIIEPPPPIPEALAVPAKLANIIYQSLAKDADDRPQSASEISEVIQEVLGQQPLANWSGPPQAEP
ncbi:MAG TPA: serine/threonine-protein kinase [Drouetiella sp.]|jgi:tRNA A-37 threonylcarbamoyl transferase component Bud32